MLKKNKANPMNAPMNYDNNAIDRIAGGTVLEGSIVSENGIRVDGTIKGSLHCKGRVVVGNNGLVEGEIVCDSADIEGTIKSSLEVAGLLELKANAVIHGDVVTGKLDVTPGAQINGKIDMGGVVKGIKEENPEQVAQEKTA